MKSPEPGGSPAISSTITKDVPMTYPAPATRHAADGKGVDVTPTGLCIICDQLKLAIDARLGTLQGLDDVEHRQARGHLRNLLDLVDAMEVARGIR